ncbi:MAG: RHS repeat-associated core domain-containing protein, partial [Nanoarchaeota archaeon]
NQLTLLIENNNNKHFQAILEIQGDKGKQLIISKEVLKPYSNNLVTAPYNGNYINEIKVTLGFQSQNKENLYLFKSTTKTLEVNKEVIPTQESQGTIPASNANLGTLQTFQEDNTKTYIFGNNLIASNNNNELTYYHQDYLSSNSLETDLNGNKVKEINYEPYGSVISEQSNDKISFTGKELDNSGLQYFGARYYNPEIGRFTQADTILNPVQGNYHYANNNPLKYVDRDGKIAFLAPLLYNPWAIGAITAATAWVASSISDPTFHEDVTDLEHGIRERDILTVGFATAGVLGPGGGRPI